jgi:hypothetical protein
VSEFTDSAGVTCAYTPIEDLKPGDVVIIGWRTTVKRIEEDGDKVRVVWEHGNDEERADQWNPRGTELPVEKTSDS